MDEFAKGICKGAGVEIGKHLIPAPWWNAVYSALDAIAYALVAWLGTLPPM